MLYALLSVFVLASVVLSACGSQAATATQAPAPTEPPAATQAPTSAPTEAATAAPTQCAPAVPNWDPTTADVGPKTMTVAFAQEPDVAVGNFSNMSFSEWIYQIYGVGTGKWDDKNNLVPYAAAEIPGSDNGGVSADGLTVTWKLKPCIFWSDGEPITSKDIAFTWKAYQDTGNNPISRSDWKHVTAVDTPDDQTAVLHFDTIYPAWPVMLDIGPNNGSGAILPAH